MKKYIINLLLLMFGFISHGQIPHHNCGSTESGTEYSSDEKSEETGSCLRHSPIAHSNELYIPYPGSHIPSKDLKVRLIFIHHSQADPRNFDANNSVHQDFMDDIFERVNQRYANFENPNNCGDFIPDSKIQFVIKERVNIVSPEFWNNCIWGDGGCSSAIASHFPIYDWLPSQGIDREMINMVFTESEGWYNEVVNGSPPDPTCGSGGCSTSSPFPSFDLTRGNLCNMLNKFTHWNALTTDFYCPTYPECCPSSCPESWLLASAVNYSHELGHTVMGPHVFDGCENLMNSSSQAVYASTDQLGKIHRGLSVNSSRRFVDGCPTSDLPLEITEDQEWDMDFRSYNDIIIKTGATLTLTCVLNMPTEKKIIVERGARLIVDGATITNSCDAYWEGIEVWGNANESQPLLTEVINGNYPVNDWDHGVVILKNGAIIENAANAIVTSKRNCGQDCHDLNFTGGIVHSENSTFLNNWRSAEFMKYETATSISNFVNTQFILNDNYTGIGLSSPKVHMTNWDVKHVKVINCVFKDERSTGTEPPNGLVSIDGTFFVRFNLFENVDTAVAIIKKLGIPGSIYVQDNTCSTANYFAVIKGATITQIHTNTIMLGSSGEAAIKIIDCTSSSVSNNNMVDGGSNANGVVYQSNGSVIHLMQNNQITDYNHAVKVLGDNGGLKILCNQFFTNQFDIRVENYASEAGEVFANQGQLTDPAGNLFSGLCKLNAGAHIFMESGSIPFTYYHHNPKAYKPTCTVGPVTIVNTGITFDPLVHCIGSTGDESEESESRMASESKPTITLYPNPVTRGMHTLSIEAAAHKPEAELTLKIFNSMGHQIEFRRMSQSTEELDISHFSDGVYFIMIQREDQIVFQEKLIVL